MKRKNIKYSLIVSLVLLMTISGMQAQVSTLYFMKNVSARHELNPAFQPISSAYIGLPFVSSLYLSIGNNSLALNNIILPQLQPDGTYKTDWFLHSQKSLDDFCNQLSDVTRIHTEFDLALLSLGFRVNHSYITLGAKQRFISGIFLPKDMFSLPLNGVRPEGDSFNLDKLAFNSMSYTELALGYSQEINSRLTIGLKAKMLLGIVNNSLEMNKFRIDASRNMWNFDIDAKANMSIPGVKYIESEDGRRIHKIDYNEPGNLSEYLDIILKPEGLGGAIDLGLTYKLFDRLTLSAAVLDLGFIKWKESSAANLPVKANFSYDGVALRVTDGQITDENGNTNFFDKYSNVIKDSVHYATTYNAYKTTIASKVMLGAEYSMLNEKLTLGALSKSTFINNTLFEEVTASVNMIPSTWFSLSASYSLINGQMGTIGLGVNGRIGPFNVYVASDYLPVHYTKEYIPYKLRSTNVQAGFVLTFGSSNKRNRDDDHDGVKNSWDKCPNTPANYLVNKRGCIIDADGDGVADNVDECPYTPAGVAVDAKGCPLDADGDGVPDYLDKCPETPAEVVVDKDGCPVDIDADGVPDYLDKCPNTPAGVVVDENGCPLDADGDGVPDYLDKCPNTPAGFAVDVNGCPVDADGDGVPDDLDKCPNTLAGVAVDANGCPLDTDGDGVPDYLDKCPETPAEVVVDANGCPLDTDGDGVPDYLDKCVDTPVAAHGFVDESGCPKDTDEDGVPDYLDQCPTEKGVPENNGCPAVVNEAAKKVFEKARQDVQFENGKDVIKKASFAILNEVVTILQENPNYQVNINGHTDNVGNPKNNQILSEKRANAVKTYLTKGGVNDSRLTAQGFGDTQPVEPNTTAANKAKNRRVEFVVKIITE